MNSLQLTKSINIWPIWKTWCWYFYLYIIFTKNHCAIHMMLALAIISSMMGGRNVDAGIGNKNGEAEQSQKFQTWGQAGKIFRRIFWGQAPPPETGHIAGNGGEAGERNGAAAGILQKSSKLLQKFYGDFEFGTIFVFDTVDRLKIPKLVSSKCKSIQQYSIEWTTQLNILEFKYTKQ